MTTFLKNNKICIEKINFDIAGKISLKLEDGRIIIVPLKYFPELKKNCPLKKGKNIPLLTTEQYFSHTLTLFII